MRLSRRQTFRVLVTAASLECAPEQASGAVTPVRLIVLDVGGTIIQDRGDVPDAVQNAFSRRGMRVTPEEIASWRGASKKELVKHFVAERSEATGADRDTLADAVYADFNKRVIEVYKD